MSLVSLAFVGCNAFDGKPFDPIGVDDSGGVAAVTQQTSNDDDGQPGRGERREPGGPEGPGGPNNDIGGEVCGDGQVTGTETCDTAITPSSRHSCLFSCMPLPTDPCLKPVLEGASCHTTECLFSRTVECTNHDQCCPNGCNPQTDTDCSKACGDGIVQREQGETCERASAFRDATAPDAADVCPTQCPDDGDRCTTEVLSGNAQNCNALCTRVPITALVNGDGCCPKGAGAGRDSDCVPICGNGIREGYEECDGDSDCNDKCISLLTSEQRGCVSREYFRDTKVGAKCNVCMCTSCISETESCYAGGSPDLTQRCADVVLCGYRSRCVGIGCVAGGCIDPIARAAETTNIVSLILEMSDPNTALGRAMAVGACFDRSCREVCY